MYAVKAPLEPNDTRDVIRTGRTVRTPGKFNSQMSSQAVSLILKNNKM